MKKFLLIAASAAALLAISCQKEHSKVQETVGETSIAVLTVSIPDGIATKAYSDGTKATDLYYAVYDAAKEEFLFGIDEPLKFENGSLTKDVDIRLVKNYAYDIVFWAQAPGAPYTFDQKAKTITVNNYTSDANDDERDAFYQLVEDYKVVSTTTEVDLYRPFAQINFAASDYEDVEALGLAMTSKVQISGLPNVLNVLSRTATESADADFAATSVPAASGEKISIKGDEDAYSYVSMNYVLAPEAAEMLDNVTGCFYYNNEEIKISVANVPYRRNYRTNIIGQFYTGSAHFMVEIIPLYDDPAFEIVY